MHSDTSEVKESDESSANIKLLQPGDFATLSNFEVGDYIHAVEAYPGQGAIFARSAGTFCQVRALSQDIASNSGDQNNSTSR